MDKKVQNLITSLIENINGVTPYEGFEKPFEADNVKIEYNDGRMFVTAPDQKVSYFFTHGKFFNNLDLLKRVMYIYGVEQFGDTPIAIRTFKKEIIEKLKENR